MGDEPIIIEQFFMGSRGLLWVRLWEVKILWVWIMGVTLVIREELSSQHSQRVGSYGQFQS
jgi:hypothetical protein